MTLNEKIRKEMLARLSVMAPGDRFPGELELCREFNVSRMTVNKVITELAKEGRLIRKRGKGSFVTEKKDKSRVLTFLIPFDGFFAWQNRNAYSVGAMFSGVSSAARKAGFRVEVIPVAPDNDPHLIDFSAIEHLNADSRVIVPSTWFTRVFPFLSDRGCQVVLLDAMNRYPYPDDPRTSTFQIIDLDLASAVEGSVQRLYSAGCRRIALYTQKKPAHTMSYQVYFDSVRRRGLPELVIDAQNPIYSHPLFQHELDQMRESRCDGLIFDANRMFGLRGRDFASVMKIPAQLKYEVSHFNPVQNHLEIDPSCTFFDYERLGETAVEMLLDPAAPKHRFFEGCHQPEGRSMSARQKSAGQFQDFPL
ncbi:MAG: GntR family transcriptional regulator [Lentisphaeria bacterium]|nr:GntR family transcriptional regulator [Lentisphaeria bacterium]